jgi:hypothetical protein
MARRRWRALAVVMASGAIFDLLFGTAILLAPAPAAGLLGIELPPDRVHLRLNGLLLLILAAVYALPALRPERFHPIAPIAACGRVLGFLVLAAAWRSGSPRVFFWLGTADLFLAAGTGLAWVAARRPSPSD